MKNQIVDQQKKNSGGGGGGGGGQPSTNSYGARPKSLGTRRGLNSPFIPPIKPSENEAPAPHAADRPNSNINETEKLAGTTANFFVFVHVYQLISLSIACWKW